MKYSVLKNRLMALVFLVGALTFTMMVDTAEATACREVLRDFYEEPELLNWCGYRYTACFGVFWEGCNTPYFVTDLGPCCGTCCSGCEGYCV